METLQLSEVQLLSIKELLSECDKYMIQKGIYVNSEGDIKVILVDYKSIDFRTTLVTKINNKKWVIKNYSQPLKIEGKTFEDTYKTFREEETKIPMKLTEEKDWVFISVEKLNSLSLA